MGKSSLHLVSMSYLQKWIQNLFNFRPDFRPFIRSLLLDPSCRNSDNNNENSVDDFIVKLLNFFVTVELLLIKKLSTEALSANGSTNFSTCDPDLVKLVLSDSEFGEKDRKRKVDLSKLPSCKLLDAGFSHVMIVRPKSGSLFSFGSTHFGVLGHGFGSSLMTSLAGSPQQQFSAPKQVEFFSQLNRESPEASDPEEIYSKLSRPERTDDDKAQSQSISVLAVAAGKTHSMALTDCGLYTWGSSKYGQLGLGMEKLVRILLMIDNWL